MRVAARNCFLARPSCHAFAVTRLIELAVKWDPILPSSANNVIDAKTIKRASVQQGIRTLRGDGALKVFQGRTSVAEVLRATEDEGNVVQS